MNAAMTDDVERRIGPLTWSLAAATTVVIVGLITFSLVFTIRRAATPTMSPAIAEGDYLVLSRFNDTPKRGDVVVWENEFGAGPRQSVVHRVIGLGGDELTTVDGVVRRNGVPLDEPYLAPGTTTTGLGAITVPDGMMFVLGDRRESSFDSRRLGAVPVTRTLGVVETTGPPWHLVLAGTSILMTFLTAMSYLVGRARFVPDPGDAPPVTAAMPTGPPRH
jgi:signal peptidase I